MDQNLKLANAAFKKKHWHEAAALYEKVYQSQPSAKINHLLVKSLFEDQQYQSAYVTMMENLNSYLMDEMHLELMVQVLLAVHQIMMAHILMATLPKKADRLDAMIEKSEMKARQQPDFKADYQAFYQLSSLTAGQQQRVFERGKQLPFQEWWTATKALLVDPFVKPIIRVSLLEMVQKLKIAGQFDFRWLDDHNYEIDGAQLKSLANFSKVDILEGILQKMVSDHDPVSQQLFRDELGLQVTLLYPFIDKAITDPETWVSRLVQGDLVQSAQLPEPYSIEWWQRKLSHIMSEMTGA
ncbi:hypothetical protein [Secundilactobacillus folii]|uniref:TPR repeat-containing protein n=1 Tax=Secundilactobacillus folii TaxID=2678357 RepID=A0A7X3C2D0_9LACO|nr:hypothetical protein [Secundilactobacillus folii]MTV81347.1 hypothetical protein [Secundilactobacillus folii]